MEPRCCPMATLSQPSSPKQVPTDHGMHDVDYLRARASDLRSAAATARDPEVARALQEVAGDFDNEAQREEVRQSDGTANE